MKTLAKNLNSDDREEFAERFYEIADMEDDFETSSPWGCPWYHGGDVILEGDTVKEMVENFWKENQKNIQELILDMHEG